MRKEAIECGTPHLICLSLPPSVSVCACVCLSPPPSLPAPTSPRTPRKTGVRERLNAVTAKAQPILKAGITHEKAEELEQKQREAVGDTKSDQEPGEAVRKRERLAARKLEERENVSDQAEMRIADSKCGSQREKSKGTWGWQRQRAGRESRKLAS